MLRDVLSKARLKQQVLIRNRHSQLPQKVIGPVVPGPKSRTIARRGQSQISWGHYKKGKNDTPMHDELPAGDVL